MQEVYSGSERHGRRTRKVRANGRRQVWTGKKCRAQILVMALALNHPADRKFQKVSAGIGSKRNQGFRCTDFGKRGANGRGNPRAVCDRRLREAVRRCNTVNEFRVGKHGRARKDDRCNIGAVVGKRVHHVMGHILGACETFGKSGERPARRGRRATSGPAARLPAPVPKGRHKDRYAPACLLPLPASCGARRADKLKILE
jgi:hypothetical protein